MKCLALCFWQGFVGIFENRTSAVKVIATNYALFPKIAIDIQNCLTKIILVGIFITLVAFIYQQHPKSIFNRKQFFSRVCTEAKAETKESNQPLVGDAVSVVIFAEDTIYVCTRKRSEDGCDRLSSQQD